MFFNKRAEVSQFTEILFFFLYQLKSDIPFLFFYSKLTPKGFSSCVLQGELGIVNVHIHVNKLLS